jgi:hypothetical protein
MTFDGSFFQKTLRLEQGKKYRVTWKKPVQRRFRVLVGVFHVTLPNGNLLLGTTEINPKWVLQCVQVADDTPVGEKRK